MSEPDQITYTSCDVAEPNEIDERFLKRSTEHWTRPIFYETGKIHILSRSKKSNIFHTHYNHVSTPHLFTSVKWLQKLYF